MRSLGLFLVLFGLISHSWCKQTDERYPQCPANTQRRIREIDLDFRHALVCDLSTWRQYPQLIMNPFIPFGQMIQITVNIQTAGTVNSYLASRLMVDKHEVRQFRQHTGYTYHQNHFKYGKIYLEKGRHEIKVQYRCRQLAAHDPAQSDWPLAFFRIDYSQPN